MRKQRGAAGKNIVVRFVEPPEIPRIGNVAIGTGKGEQFFYFILLVAAENTQSIAHVVLVHAYE